MVVRSEEIEDREKEEGCSSSFTFRESRKDVMASRSLRQCTLLAFVDVPMLTIDRYGAYLRGVRVVV